MSDEPDRLVTAPTWTDAMRRLRELAAQMTAAAQAVAVAGAKATPPVLAQPLARYAEPVVGGQRGGHDAAAAVAGRAGAARRDDGRVGRAAPAACRSRSPTGLISNAG